MTQSISYTIVKNTLYNALGKLWGVGVMLFLTPYIIHHVGMERYGIWALVGVLTGYAGLLDFGIRSGFVKHIAEHYAKRDFDEINRIVNSGFVFYLIFGLVLFIAAYAGIGVLLHIFNIPEKLRGEAVFVFLLGVALFCAGNAVSSFNAVLSGMQRMDLSNRIGLAMSLPNIAGVVFFLEKGYGLPGLMVNAALNLIVSSSVNFIVVFNLLPCLRFNPFLFSKKTFRALYTFGYKMQTSVVSSAVHFQMDKLLIGHFLDIGSVACYSVAAQIASKAREIPVLIISAILPTASELQARTDGDALRRLYRRSMKYVVLTGLPVFVMISLFARPFVAVWLGRGYEKTALTLQILLGSYFFNVMTGPGFVILAGMGKLRPIMRASLLGMICNLVLSVFLIVKLGYYGAVAGTAVATMIGAVYFIGMVHQTLDVPLSVLAGVVVKPFLAAALAFLVVLIVMLQTVKIGWGVLAVLSAAYLAAYGVTILMVRHLDEFDRALFSKYMSLASLKAR
jgi:O-antigen/teichoic acid export membrane protein